MFQENATKNYISFYISTHKCLSGGASGCSSSPDRNKRDAEAIVYMLLCVPSSGCLVFCLCLSVLTLLLQGLWVPLEMSSDEPAGRSPEEQGNLRASRTHMALLWSGRLVKISVKKKEPCTQSVVGPVLRLIVMGFAAETEYR